MAHRSRRWRDHARTLRHLRVTSSPHEARARMNASRLVLGALRGASRAGERRGFPACFAGRVEEVACEYSVYTYGNRFAHNPHGGTVSMKATTDPPLVKSGIAFRRPPDSRHSYPQSRTFPPRAPTRLLPAPRTMAATSAAALAPIVRQPTAVKSRCARSRDRPDASRRESLARDDRSVGSLRGEDIHRASPSPSPTRALKSTFAYAPLHDPCP